MKLLKGLRPRPCFTLFYLACLTAISGRAAISSTPEAPKAAATVQYDLPVSGSFVSLVGKDLTHAIVKVTADDGTTIDGSATVAVLNSALLILHYEAPSTSKKPATLFINSIPYAYTVVNSSSLPKDRRTIFSSDFCRVNPIDPTKCTTRLLAPADVAGNPQIKGFISNADQSEYTEAIVNALSAGKADLQYSAEATFQPAWITLYKDSDHSASAVFAATPAKPPVEADLTYLFETNACGTAAATAGVEKTTIDKVASNDPAQGLTLKAVGDQALFTHVTGPAPDIITISNLKDGNQKSLSCIARRAPSPTDTGTPLDIIFNIEDQETVHQDFGSEIAQHYIAVRLDISNRSSKKLQFNKSAIWFDVDYRQALKRTAHTAREIMSAITVDLIPVNPYSAPFVTDGSCKVRSLSGDINGPCREYRFGIEQSLRVSPINYSTALNVFDSHSERVDRTLRTIELLGGVLTTIATGGAVAQVHNSAFKDSATILTGSFLPGYRNVTQDLEGTNRKRANLVEDTMQEFVQIPSHGFTSSMVLLPRDAIVQLMNYTEWVVVDRVRNVHIDPDVLNSVAISVPKNQVQVGYTKDQVREAIGEESASTTNADGTTKFTYTSGPYSEVDFSKDGKVTASTPRSFSDQLDAATTQDAALKILRDNNLNSTALVLLNGNRLLADISGANKTLQYDSSGKHIGNYTLLYSDINGYVGKTISELEKELAAKKLPTKADSYKPESGSNVPANYAMPDIQGGTISVTVGDKTLQDTSKITKIDFGGMKAASAVGASSSK